MESHSSGSGQPHAAAHAQLDTLQAMAQHNQQLKAELAKAVQLAHDAQQQTVVLQSAYTKLKSDYSQLQSQVSLLRSQAEAALAAKQSAESECEKLYGAWQEKLEAKQAEFDAIQSSMVPVRELDLIRLQIAQELSSKHEASIEDARKEVEKYRTMYHSSHHELTLLRSEHTLTTQSHQKDLAALRERFERRVAELNDRNTKLQELVADESIQENLKTTQRSNAELVVKNKSLLSENESLQTSLAESRASSETCRLRMEALAKEREATEKAHRREMDAYVKRLSELESELASSTAQISALREHNLRVTREKDHQATSYQTQLDALRFENEDLKRRLASAQSSKEQTEKASKESIESLQHKLQDLEHRLEASTQAAEYAKREHAAEIKMMKEAHGMSVRELEHHIALEKERLAQAQQQSLAMELDKNDEITNLKQRISELQAEVATLQTERDRFDERITTFQSEVASANSERDAKSQELHELQIEYENLQARFRLTGEKEHDAEVLAEKLRMENESMKNELANLSSNLDAERTRYVRERSTISSKLKGDRQTLLERVEKLQAQINEEQAAHSRESNELKRDKNKYKKMCLEMKQKMGEILREFAQTKRDHALAMDAAKFALSNAQREKEVAERRAEEFKARFGAVFPQQIVTANLMGLSHTHPAAIEASAGQHAGPDSVRGVDTAAGVHAAQQQLASLRARSAEASAQ